MNIVKCRVTRRGLKSIPVVRLLGLLSEFRLTSVNRTNASARRCIECW